MRFAPSSKSKKGSARCFEQSAIKRVPGERISWALYRLRYGALARFGLELFVAFRFAVGVGKTRFFALG